jgi:hypothetical protein
MLGLGKENNMPIADLTPNVAPTMSDNMASNKVVRVMIQAIRSNRQLITRLTSIVSSAPGGKAGIVTELGADATEASAILDKMVALVNAHKAAGSADTVNPLL